MNTEDQAEAGEQLPPCGTCGSSLRALYPLYDDEKPSYRAYCLDCAKRLGLKPEIDLASWSYLNAIFERVQQYLPKALELREQGRLPVPPGMEKFTNPLWEAFYLFCRTEPEAAAVLLVDLREEWLTGKHRLGKPPQTEQEKQELMWVELWRVYEARGMKQKAAAEEIGISPRYLNRLEHKWEEREMVKRRKRQHPVAGRTPEDGTG